MKQIKYDIKELAGQKSRLQPREKLVSQGPDTMSNAELLAVIFITGTRAEGVLDLSARCLKEYGSRSITNIKDVTKVQQLLGLGNAKACQLVAVFELGRRFFKETSERMPIIRGPEDVYRQYKDMAKLKKEEVRAIYLNTRQRVIHEELLSIGGLDEVNITPQVVLQPAVELMAKSLILIHNHPSGELDPSREDIALTQSLKRASMILNVQFLDHIVIGDGWKSVY